MYNIEAKRTRISPEIIATTISFCLFTFLFLLLKQILKTTCGISASIATFIAFAPAYIGQLIFEKYVCHNKERFNGRQGLLALIRFGFDISIYTLLALLFHNMLHANYFLVGSIAAVVILCFNYYFGKKYIFKTSLPNESRLSSFYNLFYKNRYVLFSGLITFIIFAIISFVFALYPFGDNLIFKHDLYHQYAAMFYEFYDVVTKHKSFLYSWNSGGSSFFGDYFNYLSSPLSYLIFLFDREQIAGALNILIVLKGVLISMSFAYYLKESKNEHSYVAVALSLAYTFSGYFLANFWNVMWLDALIILPFVTLGIEKIINDGKGKLYLFSLVLLFISNYYTGYMICIYAVVYFFAYYFSKYSIKDKLDHVNKFRKITLRIINRGLIFAFYSLIAGMLCACFLFPVYCVLQNSSATTDSFPTDLSWNFGMLDFMTSHLAGLETTFRSNEGDVLPNVYCSVVSVISVVLYFLNNKVSIKNKIMYSVLLIFFVLSFNTNITNYIWHAFHVPNDIPYRYSFIYIFIFLTIAAEGLQNLKSLESKDIMYVGMAFVVLIAIMQKNQTDKMSNTTILISLIFVIIYTFALIAYKNCAAKKTISLALVIIMFFETFLSGCFIFKPMLNNSSYTRNISSMTEAAEYINNVSDNFYRTEQISHDTNNDARLYDCNSLTAFSSMAYERFSHFQQFVGTWSNGKNSFCYHPQTPVYNMIYGVKYLVGFDNDSIDEKYYKQIEVVDENTKIYENKYSLPVLFTVPKSCSSWQSSGYNPFAAQSNFIKEATGVDNLYNPVRFVNFETTNDSFDAIDKNGIYEYDVNQKGNINVTIEPEKDGNVYIVAFAFQDEKTKVTYQFDNGNEKTQETYEPYIYDLGNCNKGENIRISMNFSSLCNDNDPSGKTPVYFLAYTLNDEALDAAYNILQNNIVQNTEYNETHIHGVVNATEDSYIYTSIPYDSSWVAYIDGKKVDTTSIGTINASDTGAQLMIPISKGEHSVELKYIPKGILSGCIISVVGLILMLYFVKKNKKML